jgi:hypothetical protein
MRLPQERLFKVKESESEIQKKIFTILKYKKKFPIRYNSGVMSVGKRFVRFYILWNGKSSGHPDLQFLHNRQIYYVEVKSKKGKLSEEQIEFKQEMEKQGIPVLVYNNWLDMLEYVENLN